jgi:prepilin signal peptidase PulO-like enzyme (type II secretory pathway)
MERTPFFPDPYFAWTFYLVLVAFTLLGAYFDLRRAILPKRLTLSLLAVGVVFNIVRGAWLGSLGLKLSWLPAGNIWLGAADGFLFSLIGFVLTTPLFIIFWIMKLMGGGDVKLFAALGAWIGFKYSIVVMLVSVFVMVVLLIGRLLAGGLSPMAVRKRIKQSQVIQSGPGKGKWKMTYALPVAVSVAVVLLWFYRFDLNLADRGKTDSTPIHAEASHD